MPELSTAEEWAAYRALPEWEVTARLSRTARFRMHATSGEEARTMLLAGENGIQSMDDLYDGEMEIESVISVEAVTRR